MTLNVTIKKRIATYISGQGIPVCGNTGDQVKFTFDEEWAQHETKVARFKWGGKVFDQEFTGNICEIPNIDNADFITIGVFVGEEEDGEEELSTTDTKIPYKRSTRCGKNVPHAESGLNYTIEARGYAADAKASADQAQEAMANIEQYKGLEEMGSILLEKFSFGEYESLHPAWTLNIVGANVGAFCDARYVSLDIEQGTTITEGKCFLNFGCYAGDSILTKDYFLDICIWKNPFGGNEPTFCVNGDLMNLILSNKSYMTFKLTFYR